MAYLLGPLLRATTLRSQVLEGQATCSDVLGSCADSDTCGAAFEFVVVDAVASLARANGGEYTVQTALDVERDEGCTRCLIAHSSNGHSACVATVMVVAAACDVTFGDVRHFDVRGHDAPQKDYEFDVQLFPAYSCTSLSAIKLVLTNFLNK